jgi:predicted nucleic acid-binding protein
VTFFVDANVIVYAATPCPQRDRCVGILRSIGRRTADGRTSPAVLEEIRHLELSGRIAGLGDTALDAYQLFTPLLSVTEEAFRVSLELDTPQLDSYDRLHAGTCADHGIDVIVSADAGFDGVQGLRRVDPMDERACRELLGAA